MTQKVKRTTYITAMDAKKAGAAYDMAVKFFGTDNVSLDGWTIGIFNIPDVVGKTQNAYFEVEKAAGADEKIPY